MICQDPQLYRSILYMEISSISIYKHNSSKLWTFYHFPVSQIDISSMTLQRICKARPSDFERMIQASSELQIYECIRENNAKELMMSCEGWCTSMLSSQSSLCLAITIEVQNDQNHSTGSLVRTSSTYTAILLFPESQCRFTVLLFFCEMNFLKYLKLFRYLKCEPGIGKI